MTREYVTDDGRFVVEGTRWERFRVWLAVRLYCIGPRCCWMPRWWRRALWPVIEWVDIVADNDPMLGEDKPDA